VAKKIDAKLILGEFRFREITRQVSYLWGVLLKVACLYQGGHVTTVKSRIKRIFAGKM